MEKLMKEAQKLANENNRNYMIVQMARGMKVLPHDERAAKYPVQAVISSAPKVFCHGCGEDVATPKWFGGEPYCADCA